MLSYRYSYLEMWARVNHWTLISEILLLPPYFVLVESKQILNPGQGSPVAGWLVVDLFD